MAGNIVKFPVDGVSGSAREPKEKEAKAKRSRRADGLIQVECRYADETGKVKKKSFYGQTYKEADAKRRAFQRDLEDGIRPEDVTVATYADNWLKTYKANLRPNTYRTYAHDVELLKEFCGAKLVKKITLSDVQAILNTRNGLSASAIKKTAMTLTAIFEAARMDRLIVFNPCDGLSIPKGTSDTHRALTMEEVTFLHTTATDHDMYAAAMLMLFAGLRRGEALAFDIDRDVDFDAMTLHVKEAVYFDGNHSQIGSTKTLAGTRIIPILEPLKDTLLSRKGTGLVLRDRQGKLMSETAFRRKWDSYIYTLEIALNGVRKRWASEEQLSQWQTVNIRCHDLRHTFATMLFDAGVDVKTAQRWLGHTDPMVTMRIYTHLSETRNTQSTDAAKAHFENLSVKMSVNEKMDD